MVFRSILLHSVKLLRRKDCRVWCSDTFHRIQQERKSGKMAQVGGAVIDQQEGTEAGASGDGPGAPFSLLVLC